MSFVTSTSTLWLKPDALCGVVVRTDSQVSDSIGVPSGCSASHPVIAARRFELHLAPSNQAAMLPYVHCRHRQAVSAGVQNNALDRYRAYWFSSSRVGPVVTLGSSHSCRQSAWGQGTTAGVDPPGSTWMLATRHSRM